LIKGIPAGSSKVVHLQTCHGERRLAGFIW
jgi:hypothetical protein